MRKTCIECALKHIGQACVLAGEVVRGYPEHKTLVYGHLAEAEEELINSENEIIEGIVDSIRDIRKRYFNESKKPKLRISLLLQIGKNLEDLKQETECGFC